MKSIKLVMIYGLVFMLISSFGFAAIGGSDASLKVRSDALGCKLDFHSAVLNNVASKVSQASNLSTIASKLQNDKTQLKALADAQDAEGFRNLFNLTVKKDIKEATASLNNARKNYKQWNVSKATLAQLKDDFKSAKNQSAQCQSATNTRKASLKAEHYTKILDNKEALVSNLSQRNVSISEMIALIQKARNDIVVPLQSAAASGDGNAAKDALEKYCLYNECKSAHNFHFAAKFTQLKYEALVLAIEPRANAANLSANVTAIRTKITESKTALAANGNNKWSKTELGAVWEPLKDAEKMFKRLVREIRKTAN